MKRTIYILVLLTLTQISCRGSKELTTDTKQKEQKNIENTISSIDILTFKQIVNQSMQKFFNEKLNININNKVYDTEKAIDTETGKHPVKEETNISLSKETNETEQDSTTITTTESTRSQLVDKSKGKSTLESSEKIKEKKGFTLLEACGLSVAASLLIGFVIFIIGKIK